MQEQMQAGRGGGGGSHERTPTHPSPWKNPEQVEGPGKSPCKGPNSTRAAEATGRSRGPGQGQGSSTRGTGGQPRTSEQDVQPDSSSWSSGHRHLPRPLARDEGVSSATLPLEDGTYRFVLITHQSQSQPEACLSPQEKPPCNIYPAAQSLCCDNSYSLGIFVYVSVTFPRKGFERSAPMPQGRGWWVSTAAPKAPAMMVPPPAPMFPHVPTACLPPLPSITARRVP